MQKQEIEPQRQYISFQKPETYHNRLQEKQFLWSIRQGLQNSNSKMFKALQVDMS